MSKGYTKTLELDKSIILTGVLIGATLISVGILAPYPVSADNDSTVDEVSITVPMSCTMSGSGMTSHNASIANGTYQANIGTTTLTAFCNDNSGFSIYATGYTGNEIGATNSNKLVGTSASNNATIDTGTATTAGNPDVSNWAMKLEAPSTPTPTYPITITSDMQGSFSSYHAVPNEYTKVATRASGTDIGTNAEGSTLTTTYAAYISKTQAADTYTGQVIYLLIHPANANIPVICNPSGTTISSIVCMQDINSSNKSSILASMIEDTQYQLYDSRDKKQYYVSKLKDGNIWMTQNLDLDIDSSVTYTSADTDLPIGTTWTPDVSTYGSDNETWYTYIDEDIYNDETEEYTTRSYRASESYDPGDLYWTGLDGTYSWHYQGCLEPDQCTVFSNSGNQHLHLGNYYSFGAALAVNDASYYVDQSSLTLVDQSICPAGWTLPRAGKGSDSFYNLVSYYTDINSFYDDEDYDLLIEDPFYLVPGGQWHGDRLGWRNKTPEAHYWTPVVYISGGTAYDIYVIFGSDFNPAIYYDYNLDWPNGATVRCIARPVTKAIQGLN